MITFFRLSLAWISSREVACWLIHYTYYREGPGAEKCTFCRDKISFPSKNMLNSTW